MDGIEKILQQIDADAQHEAQAIAAQAQADVISIGEEWDNKIKAETEGILARAEQTVAERAARADSSAQMEGRKLILQAKQDMVGKAYDRALEMLVSLPEGEKIELLAALCVKASANGDEEVILSPADREAIGDKVVARANELLAKAVAPKLPDSLADSPAGALLDKVVTVGAGLLSGTAMLRLSRDTRDIPGGVILNAGGVEVNCSFDTLVKLARPETERQVAAILFGS